jgi:hypothetical protein
MRASQAAHTAAILDSGIDHRPSAGGPAVKAAYLEAIRALHSLRHRAHWATRRDLGFSCGAFPIGIENDPAMTRITGACGSACLSAILAWLMTRLSGRQDSWDGRNDSTGKRHANTLSPSTGRNSPSSDRQRHCISGSAERSLSKRLGYIGDVSNGYGLYP